MTDPSALQPQTAIIPLVAGIDGKTDSEAVAPPALVTLNNASFFNPGGITKDTGYETLSQSTLSGSIALRSPVRRLIDAGAAQLLVDGDGILERGETPALFRKIPGGSQASIGFNPLGSCAIERVDDVVQPSTATTLDYVVVFSGSTYGLFAAQGTGLTITIREEETGTVLFTSAQTASTGCLRCCKSGTVLAAFWQSGTSLNGLRWDASTPTVAPTVVTGLNAADTNTGVLIDVAGGASNFYAVYQNATGLTLRKLSAAALANVAVGTFVAAGTLSVAICLDSSENSLIAYRDGAGPFNCKIVGFTSGAVVRSNSTVDAAATGQMSCVSNENGTSRGTVFFLNANGVVRTQVAFDGSGGPIVSNTMFNSTRVSVPFLIGTQIFMAYSWLRTDANGITERVCVVVAHDALNGDTSNSEPVAWFLYARPIAGGAIQPGQQVTAVAGAFWTDYRFAVQSNDSTSLGDSNLSVLLIKFRPWEGQAVALPNKTAAALVCNNFVSSAVGLLESSLGHAPVITSISQSATGSLVVGSTYSWQVVYEVTLPDGTVVRSPASLPVSATITAGNGQATINFTAPFSRLGIAVQSRVFRSQAGPGLTRTLLTVSSVVDRRTTALTSITDNASDASIAANRLVYTTGGVLDAQPAPPHRAVTLHQNRLFCIVEETREIRYTRDIVDGEAPAWHANLTISTLGQGVTPYALITSSNGLWILGRDIKTGAGAISLMVGDGPDDTGANSTYSIQRLETADTGPADWRHAVSTPAGIVYEDPWQGFHLLPSGGGAPTFVGAPIESSRLQAGSVGGSTAMHVILKRKEVRICNVDRILVWHYDVGQWSQRFLPGGATIGDASVWNGNHVIQSSAGILRQNAGFTDAGSQFYALKWKTAPIKTAQFAGLQRIWDIFLHGHATARHGLTVNLYFDDNPTPQVFTFTAADIDVKLGVTDKYVLRLKPRVQKCTSFAIEVLDTNAGSGTRQGPSWNAIRVNYGAFQRSSRVRANLQKG